VIKALYCLICSDSHPKDSESKCKHRPDDVEEKFWRNSVREYQLLMSDVDEAARHEHLQNSHYHYDCHSILHCADKFHLRPFLLLFCDHCDYIFLNTNFLSISRLFLFFEFHIFSFFCQVQVGISNPSLDSQRHNHVPDYVGRQHLEDQKRVMNRR